MLSDQDKKQLQTKLEQEFAILEREIDSFTKEFPGTPGGHEAYIENAEKTSQEDHAEVSEEYNKRKALESIMENRLAEIRHALTLLGTPGYGVCPQCHASIPLDRLMINPAAETCIQCAK